MTSTLDRLDEKLDRKANINRDYEEKAREDGDRESLLVNKARKEAFAEARQMIRDLR